MEMVVQHKDRRGEVTHERRVREGAIDYVACVKCRGTGIRYCIVGGNLMALGWAMYQDFGCPDCQQRGAWRCN